MKAIKSQADAEAAIQRINEIDSAIARLDISEATSLARVRERHRDIRIREGQPELEAEKKLVTTKVQAWAKKARKGWETKSLKTAFGEVGYRLPGYSVTLIKKVTPDWESAVVNVSEGLGTEYIRTTEAVDKDLLLKDRENFDASELELAGLKFKNKEKFFLETTAGKAWAETLKKLKAK